jgi:hypothetical protein
MRVTVGCFLLTVATAAAGTPLPRDDALMAAEAREKPYSHCSAQERLIFSCEARGKVVSVCGVQVQPGEKYSVQYRFGKLGAIELSVPSSIRRSGNTTAMKRIDWASSYAVYLRFQESAFTYYVYEAAARGPDDPTSGTSTWVEPMGVVVKRGGKLLRRLNCEMIGHGHSSLSHPELPASITAKQLPDEEGADPDEIAFPR